MIEKIFTKKNIVIALCIFLTLLVLLVIYSYFVNKELIIQGEIEAKTINVASKIPGRVETLFVEEGDEVNKDDVLLELSTPEIDAKSMQANAMLDIAKSREEEVYNGARQEQIQMAYSKMEQAKSAYTVAQKSYDRIKKLHEEGVIPTQKLDETYAIYDGAKKALEMATSNYNMVKKGARAEDKKAASAGTKAAFGAVSEVQSFLNENKVKSPIKGQVTKILAEAGEVVAPGFTIVTVTDNNDAWVVLNLREDMLSKVRMGSSFNVEIPALGLKNVEVKVNYISPLGAFATNRATKIRGDFDLKTFEIHAKPIEQIEGLRAGMTVVVNWGKVKKPVLVGDCIK